MKIYTRTGDDGTTGLFGGSRVDKDAVRIAAYGTVDELNSFVGLALSGLDDDRFEEATTMLTTIQHDLFVAGADLATPQSAKPSVPRIDQGQIDKLETFIDRLEEDLEPLKTFILPGGVPAAARIHVARTVCRRSERLCITLARSEPINTLVPVYLNRLSDLFFVMARWINRKSQISDIPWIPEKAPK